MVLRKAVIPYHFGIHWNILPATGDWRPFYGSGIASRLASVARWQPDLVVAGDCMAAIAAHRDGLPLIWFDAHGDYHTLVTTETGHLGGMPLAMLHGVGDQSLLQSCIVAPITDIYHVGGSEFDEGEQQRMVSQGIHVLPRISLRGNGVMSFVLQRHHLHIDTDVICSNDLPSSIHPAPNGMLLDTFHQQLEMLWPAVEVLSIKTPDPRLDVGGTGNKIVLDLIRRFEHERASH